MQLNPQLVQAPRTRVNRFPTFSCAGVIRPYGLYPIFVHPVLPGETLQSCSIKLRHWSGSLENVYSGAWLENWLVYIKLTDIDPDLGQMFVSDALPDSKYVASTSSNAHFTSIGQIDWVRMCVEKFASSYFIDEGETLRTPANTSGMPFIKVNNKGFYQNVLLEEADVTVPTGDASDLADHMRNYSMLQQMQMTEMSYEKYLEQYGSFTKPPSEGDPEILRFSRSWVLPRGQSSPIDGEWQAAHVYKDEIKLDKAKRFSEPGFLVYFSAYRPKVYNYQLKRSMVGELWGFSDWWPAYTNADANAQQRSIMSDSEVFESSIRTDSPAVSVLYDHQDLLSHGEEFVGVKDNSIVTFPEHTGMQLEDASTEQERRGEYISETDGDSLFTSTDPIGGLVYEGAAFATISGHVQDLTPM